MIETLETLETLKRWIRTQRSDLTEAQVDWLASETLNGPYRKDVEFWLTQWREAHYLTSIFIDHAILPRTDNRVTGHWVSEDLGYQCREL